MKRSRDNLGQFDSRQIDSIVNRFESQFTTVPESGCWIWTGAEKSKFGYGAFKLGARKSPVLYAHRFAWELYRGVIPDGVCVLHRCDVPQCVNPDHLFLGTAKDNAEDKVAKGRHVRGSATYNSKINESIASEIKKLSGTPTKVLAAMFGLSRQSVADIIFGRTWKHV